MPVYITDIASFLPNAPIDNDRMEELLGIVNELPSRTRKIILRNNRINSRYYAIDPATGASTHTNAQLTAAAIRRLRPVPDFSPDQIECLCCGTSSPDQLMPGHGSMVHGELQGKPCEVMSAAGICTAGMSAMKYAWMSVASGQTSNAVATGSELASSFMRSSFCGPVDRKKAAQVQEQPTVAFEADFLRWMLSDGAGAAFLSNQPANTGLSLRIDWIDLLSFANDIAT
jgi:3-oxoacyl-[acyl-carrier-protein] synthase-3